MGWEIWVLGSSFELFKVIPLSLRKFLGLAILGFSLKDGWVMHCGDVVLNCEVDDGKMWFWEIDEVLAKGINLVLEAISI